MPDATNYTNLRKNLSACMDQVCDTHEPLIVTRQKAKPVVMLSLEDYNAIMETAHLLGSPANAQRLRESISQDKAGNTVERELLEH